MKSVDPLGGVSLYTYEPVYNQMASSINALGNKNEFFYDAKGNLIQSKDPAGNITQYSYDSRGNLIQTKDPLENTTTFTYDLRGLPLTLRNAPA